MNDLQVGLAIGVTDTAIATLSLPPLPLGDTEGPAISIQYVAWLNQPTPPIHPTLPVVLTITHQLDPSRAD